jgi:hypothetical protein
MPSADLGITKKSPTFRMPSADLGITQKSPTFRLNTKNRGCNNLYFYGFNILLSTFKAPPIVLTC